MKEVSFRVTLVAVRTVAIEVPDDMPIEEVAANVQRNSAANPRAFVAGDDIDHGKVEVSAYVGTL